METELIRIGNSRGVRIPSAILKQCGFKGTLRLDVKNSKLVISNAAGNPRAGWDKALARAAAAPLEISDGLDISMPDWTW